MKLPTPEFYDVGDVESSRTRIFNAALDAAKNLEPVSNTRYTLGLQDVRYQGPERLPKAAHKKAILHGTDLTRKLSGTWVLSDNATGKPVAQRRSVIAHIPYLTDLGTFARAGNDYSLSHQLRLKPGVYTRWMDNGELEAHVNVAGGMGHKIFLEPETGIFRMKLGQAKIPLMDVLNTLGVDTKQLQQSWGSALYRVNATKTDPKALNKLYSKLIPRGTANLSEETRKQAVRDAFNRMGLDPDVSLATLGKPYASVTPEVLLDTTQKLIRINKGEIPTDSRDNMTFQRLYGPAEIIAERIQKSGNILRTHLWKASQRNALDRLPSGILDKQIEGALISSGLGLPIEGVNPLEMFDNLYRVTRLGDGGIPSLDAIPDSARNVHPSQVGLIDVIRTPESLKVGVDTRLASNMRHGSDGRMYMQVLDRKGVRQWKSVEDLYNHTVAVPGALNTRRNFVPTLRNGRMLVLPKTEVEYVMPYMQYAQHSLGTLVPATAGVKGQRAVMAARMLTQALPLVNPQAPYVQSGIPDEKDKSYEELYGERAGAVRAKTVSRVKKVTPDSIVTIDETGKEHTHDLYNNMVFNRKTGMTQVPVVAPGDWVQPGDLLAKSDFTDDSGTTAVGLNARVAFLPFRGLNYEDGIVVSDSFAKRMTSKHYYKSRLPMDKDTHIDKQRYLAMKPGVYTKEQMEHFDTNGVVRPGTRVQTGDPLILGIRKNEPSELQKKAGRKASYRDVSVTWEHTDPGIVTDVNFDRQGAHVIVQTQQPLQVADKLSGRYGNKGVVAAIIPDDELPTMADGGKPEVLLTPVGIAGRVNPAQAAEAMLGKVAAVTGKRYAVKDFDTEEDIIAFAERELKKYGLTDREDLTDSSDPSNPKVIPKVFNGNMFFMKLHHSAESKAQGRGLGSYTADSQPSRGGDDSAKRIGMLELSALLSHGATRNIADLKYVKGQENFDWWRQYTAGFNPPTPRVPYVYHKFVNYLKGAGIHVERKGPRLHIMAMTSKDVDNMTEGRELKGVKDLRTGLYTIPTVSWDDNLKPVAGGLFDPKVTGADGDQWSYIKIGAKLPNPVMEQPLRFMLGMTESEFRDVLTGKKTIDTGSGPEALYKAAQNINIDQELESARAMIRSNRKTARDAAIRRIGYLKSAKTLGQRPEDWFLDKVPVLPPKFRPVSQIEGRPLVADANYLYKQLFDNNQAYIASKQYFGEQESGELTGELYDSFKAITGLGEPTTKELQQKGVKGLLKTIFGKGPKYSMMQTRLLGTPVDMAGRGVIVPDPNYDMDTIGIPESTAWEVYTPLVVRELRRHGRNGMRALEEIEQKTPAARKILQELMESRPVLFNRAPTLHKFGIMAVYPKMIQGHAIKVNPFLCKGFNADFDGNCVDYHTEVVFRIPGKVSCGASGSSLFTQTMHAAGIETGVSQGYEYCTLKIGEVPHSDKYHVDGNGAKIYALTEPWEVLACEPSTGIAGFYPLEGITIEEDCPTQEVTIADRQVTVSANESLTCFDSQTGGLKKITPEAGRDNLIPVFKQSPLPYGPHGDRDLGWWLGSLISSGKISNGVFDSLQKSNEFDKLSTLLGFENYTTLDTIPTQFLSLASEDCLWGLLSGLLDGSGRITLKRYRKKSVFSVNITTMHVDLVDSLKRLCYRLGLRYRIKSSNKKSYRFSIHPYDFYYCIDKLTLTHGKVCEVIRTFKMSEPPKDTEDVVPVSDGERDTLLSIADRKIASVLHTALRTRKRYGYSCLRSILDKYAYLYKKTIPSLYARVLNRRTIWSSVTDIQNTGNRTVYDLIVPGVKVFCANQGIIVQDTMVFHVPVSLDAIQEAEEKMLPSRNLLAPGNFDAAQGITKEYVIGLYESTRKRFGEKTVATFATRDDVVRAYRQGRLNPQDTVRVLSES